MHARQRFLLAAGAWMLLGLVAPQRAEAIGSPIAVGEVTTRAPLGETDAAAVRTTAIEELGKLGRLGRRQLVVSLSVQPAASTESTSCTVDATLRDARTGTMLAVIETGAQASGPTSTELRRELAVVAVRSAVRKIPSALNAL
jgi:hypothetical protein